jgi:ATP-binding cassette subfamily B protein
LSVGAVFHSPQLFDGTIEENIRLGRPKASAEEVRHAARLARLDQFISTLPEGYGTPVPKGGVALSAGQIQRLAIARALIRKPALLLLDEATSNLDEDSERAIWTMLESGSEGRTLVFVTHRLKTSARAERIVVLDGGRVVESGSYSELMAKRGAYYGLWQRQSVIQMLA